MNKNMGEGNLAAKLPATLDDGRSQRRRIWKSKDNDDVKNEATWNPKKIQREVDRREDYDPFSIIWKTNKVNM